MYIVTTAPAVPVVSLSEIKKQLILDESFTDDDGQLAMLEQVNREYVETYLNRILPEKELKIRYYPKTSTEIIRVPTPANSIVSMTAFEGGLPVAIDVEDYEIYRYSEPNYIMPKYGKEWPVVDYIEVTLNCGYAAADMPVVFKQAILIKITEQYENRTEQVRDRMNNVTDMLYRYRIAQF